MNGSIMAADGDGHVMEDAKRIARMLEEPYREFRAPTEVSDDLVPIEPLVPLDGMDRNLGTRLFRGRAHSAEDWLEALDRGPLEWSAVYPDAWPLLGVRERSGLSGRVMPGVQRLAGRDVLRESRRAHPGRGAAAYARYRSGCGGGSPCRWPGTCRRDVSGGR